jgi:hypothetical protein
MASLFVLLGALVAGLAVLYFLLRSRLDRRLARVDPAAEIRDELASVMVEMNRTTDRNVALLEDRISQLTRLIAEADRKMGLLRRESEKNEASRMVYTQLARPAAAMEAERAAAEAAGPAGPAAPAGAPRPPGAAEQSLESRVLMLEREGFSAAVIANRVGSTVGEVELIISLARRRP